MQVIELFKRLSTIPHCSGSTEAIRAYLTTFAKRYGYEVSSDEAGNLLCTKSGSAITLQAHQDMVCIGKAPELGIIEEDGWLHAQESTLGADNGMGMAMMLALMQAGMPVDALFTSDEEIGLIGARDLQVGLKTSYLLNLDSEEEGIVTIGCAGGVDIIARLPLKRVSKTLYCHEIEISGLPGGHSGVDIDKDIPNAIKLLAAKSEVQEGRYLLDIQGGERRNAIAKHAVALIGSETPIEIEDTKASGQKEVTVIEEGARIIAMLDGFEHGVRSLDEELGIVKSSINLAQVHCSDDEMVIHLSARSMEKEALQALERETHQYFSSFGCHVTSEGFYTPWRPEKTEFGEHVLEITRQRFPEATFGAIHAGLECGIIKEHFPNMQMASIGPTILYPHSTRERVDVASVEAVFESVKAIVEELSTAS